MTRSRNALSLKLVSADSPYELFSQINGNHSYKSAVPGGFVDYEVRRRKGGRVLFFNFELAKEMGLIPSDHPHQLNPELSQRILDTFALVIINEYDIQHGRKFPKDEILPNRYMATRYLQLQHPNKQGKTSGDGRGIWNGEFKAKGVTWDVSSSGTGATCLSPAVAIEKKYFKTGDPRVSYGSGYNCPDDGLNTALMSEVFHLNGLNTERTLTIIEFAGGTSINVRASRNLLRPSHLFHHLKQGNHARLKGAVDYFIERQVANGEWQLPLDERRTYDDFAERMALNFARMAAQFESEYVFCWMDWDGDNILATAGIIDYGSVRQFGLFHDEYRYDDVDRFSTKLAEQKSKARYTVQTFAQIRDFLKTGRKRNIRHFKDDAVLALFDRQFDKAMDEFLLRRIGLDQRDRSYLMKTSAGEVRAFRKIFAHFERTQTSKGIYKTEDGVTSDAAFSLRDLLRELPKLYLEGKTRRIEPQKFVDIMKSSFARRKDLRIGRSRLRRIAEFQERYCDLIERVAASRGDERPVGAQVSAERTSDARAYDESSDRVMLEVAMRSSLLNRFDRLTGDGVIEATNAILKLRKKLSQDELQALIEKFVQTQVLDPARVQAEKNFSKRRLHTALERVRREVVVRREGI